MDDSPPTAPRWRTTVILLALLIASHLPVPVAEASHDAPWSSNRVVWTDPLPHARLGRAIAPDPNDPAAFYAAETNPSAGSSVTHFRILGTGATIVERLTNTARIDVRTNVLSIAAHEEFVAVGTPSSSQLYANGSVDVFRRVSTDAEPRHEFAQTLTINETSAGYGHALTAWQDMLVVGAPNGAAGGSVHVYRLHEGTWHHAHTLYAPLETADADFGRALAVVGDRLAVSAPDTTAADAPNGAVFVYTLTPDGPSHSATIKGGDGLQRMGIALAGRGALLAIGTQRCTTPDGWRGCAELYDLSGPPSHLQTIWSTQSRAEANFGTAMAWSGAGLHITAPHDRPFGSYSQLGVAHRFNPDATGFHETALYSSSVSWDAVGFGIASTDELLVLGAHQTDVAGAENRGALYVAMHDADEDGVGDLGELSYGTDPFDPDGDDDGLTDGDELSRGTNPFEPDSDDDGLTDGTEVHDIGSNPMAIDSDGDGLEDAVEWFILGTSPIRRDTDDDLLSDPDELHVHGTDPLDPDGDTDRLRDGEEILLHGTDPLDPDSDNDGLDDGMEWFETGTDPALFDTDDDLLGDGAELNVHGTDPLDPDMDRDLLRDGEEVLHGTSPYDDDTDADELIDGREVHIFGSDPHDRDTDGDLFSDGYEVGTGSDPTNPWDVPGPGPHTNFFLPLRTIHDQTDDEEPIV